MKSIIALLLFTATTYVSAASFTTLIPERSSISFVSKQMGVEVMGNFVKFNSQISLDPPHPETSKAQITIMLASVDAGSTDANDEVKGKAWFNIKEYPSATFISSGLKALGANRYQAIGKLTIKGKVREVAVPFMAVPAGSNLVLDGSIPISRAAYGIGEGAWADTTIVADDVQVKFHFTLSAAK